MLKTGLQRFNSNEMTHHITNTGVKLCMLRFSLMNVFGSLGSDSTPDMECMKSERTSTLAKHPRARFFWCKEKNGMHDGDGQINQSLVL